MVYPTRGETEAGFHRVLFAIKDTKRFNKVQLYIETETERLFFRCCYDMKAILKMKYDNIWFDERCDLTPDDRQEINSRKK